MLESVQLNDHVLQTFPLRNHDVTCKIIQVVFWNAGHSYFHHRPINLHLNLRWFRLQEVPFHQFMNMLSVVIDLRTGSPQIKIAVVNIESFIRGNCFNLGNVLLDHRIERRQFMPLVEHT